MRGYLAFAFVALPTAAVAAPSLQCSFDGHKTKIVVANSADKERRCNYACNYTIQNGYIKLSGEGQKVKAGKTYTREDSHREKIESVSESSPQCE
jgi:hypothetical protein